MPRKTDAVPACRILVSSPDPDVARFVREALAGQAFMILPPCQPKDVTEVVLDQSPDVLLFEVDRRSGSPAETLRVVRKMRPEMRIIALSVESRPEDAEIVEVGLFYYDSKPVGPELVEILKAAARHPGEGRLP